MKVITIICMIAITMALSITLTMKNIGDDEEDKPPFKPSDNLETLSSTKELALHEKKLMPSKRASRFLADHQENSPRAANHCHKDHEFCYLEEAYNSSCCNNNCVDLATDHYNCGSCKKKCEFTEACCRGKCVELAYNKRHCGKCNNRCGEDLHCIYGMCDYP